jgi:hypothetical protein
VNISHSNHTHYPFYFHERKSDTFSQLIKNEVPILPPHCLDEQAGDKPGQAKFPDSCKCASLSKCREGKSQGKVVKKETWVRLSSRKRKES